MDNADIVKLYRDGQDLLKRHRSSVARVQELAAQLENAGKCLLKTPDDVVLTPEGLNYDFYSHSGVLPANAVGMVIDLIQRQQQDKQRLKEMNFELLKIGMDPIGGEEFRPNVKIYT